MTRLLNDAETSHLLAIRAQVLRRLVRDRRIPHVLLPDGEVRFDVAEVRGWVDAHRVKYSGPPPSSEGPRE